MTIKVPKRAIIQIGIGLYGWLLCIIGVLSGYSLTNVACIYMLFISIYLVWWSRKNSIIWLVFVTLAYSNYSIALSEYLVVKPDTLFTIYAGTEVAGEGIYILLFFWSTLVICLPQRLTEFTAKKHPGYWQSSVGSGWNTVIVLALEVLLIYIWRTGFRRPISSGGRGAPGAVYEYAGILLILCYYIGGKSRFCHSITTVTLIAYVLQNFIFGGRIIGLQFLLLYYEMNVEERISLPRLIPIVGVLYILLTVIGVYRGEWIHARAVIPTVWEKLRGNLFTLDTAYSSYHTSLTFLLAEEHTGISTRLKIFASFLKAIVMGHYGTPENSVTHYTGQFYRHYEGGVLPFFFHFYFGWIGVPLIAVYLAYIIRRLSRLTEAASGLRKCLSVYFVTTSFRWYLYSPIQLTRGIGWMVLCYILIQFGLILTERRGKAMIRI